MNFLTSLKKETEELHWNICLKTILLCLTKYLALDGLNIKTFFEISLAVRLQDDISLQLEALAIPAKAMFFKTRCVFIFKSLVQIGIIRQFIFR